MAKTTTKPRPETLSQTVFWLVWCSSGALSVYLHSYRLKKTKTRQNPLLSVFQHINPGSSWHEQTKCSVVYIRLAAKVSKRERKKRKKDGTLCSSCSVISATGGPPPPPFLCGLFLFLFYLLVLFPVHLCLTVFVQLPRIPTPSPPLAPRRLRGSFPRRCLSSARWITFCKLFFQQSPLDETFSPPASAPTISFFSFFPPLPLSRSNNVQPVSGECDGGFACCSFYVGQIPHEVCGCQRTAPEYRLSDIIMAW